ncbi:MAG: hypothetical protein ACLP5O_15295, partial [Acidimicrobiales bacterium]
ECDQFARHVEFGTARHFDLAAGPNDGQRIVIAIERNAVADFVSGGRSVDPGLSARRTQLRG